MGLFLFPKEGFSLLLATAIIQAACKIAEYVALSEEKERCSNHNSSFLIETEASLVQELAFRAGICHRLDIKAPLLNELNAKQLSAVLLQLLRFIFFETTNPRILNKSTFHLC